MYYPVNSSNATSPLNSNLPILALGQPTSMTSVLTPATTTSLSAPPTPVLQPAGVPSTSISTLAYVSSNMVQSDYPAAIYNSGPASSPPPILMANASSTSPSYASAVLNSLAALPTGTVYAPASSSSATSYSSNNTLPYASVTSAYAPASATSSTMLPYTPFLENAASAQQSNSGVSGVLSSRPLAPQALPFTPSTTPPPASNSPSLAPPTTNFSTSAVPYAPLSGAIYASPVVPLLPTSSHSQPNFSTSYTAAISSLSNTFFFHQQIHLIL